MKLLSVDTSTNVCSVCISDEGRIVADYTTISSRTHTERLLPAIDLLFSHVQWKVDALDGLAVINGPGSFTGLRISLSIIKGLAFALSIPVVAFNALEVAANQVTGPGFICPAMDARRGEIFTALFERAAQGIRQWIEPRSISPEKWRKLLPDAPIQFCGPGARIYFDRLKNYPESTLLFEDFILSRTLAELASEAFRRGEAITGSQLKAAYLRPSDAETKGPRPTKRVTVRT